MNGKILNRKPQLFSYLVLTTLIFTSLSSCSKKMSEKDIANPDISNSTFLESKVLVFQNGEYVDVDTDNNPVPVQGKDKFYRDMYLDLRYPAIARRNSTQGTVMFEVRINELGKVENIERISSLSPECDKEAEAAIERGCNQGFEPYVYKDKAVKVKYLIPVKFRLE